MSPRTRKHAFCLILCISLVGLNPASVNAWGPDGHRIVALVATNHLDPPVLAKVNQLLEGQTLADVANWADDVRNQRPETAPWHFVNLPKTAARFSRPRDCADVGGEPGCAVTAIEKYRAVLANPSASQNDRAEALKFIVHFVGDLHQPLHVSYKEDKGGNNIKVTFFGKKSNLHKVWDSGIIGWADLSEADFASELEAVLTGDVEFETDAETRRKIERMQGGSIDSWTNESYGLARRNAYDRVRPGARLGQNYYDTNWQVVDDQLTKAGLRLAKILNDALR